MFQWSKNLNVPTTSEGYELLYPTAFSEEVLAILITKYGRRANGTYAAGSYTTTSFKISCYGDCIDFVWLAIGY